MTTLSKEDVVRALEALESMDDFARMGTGVDPIGPYKVLREFIAARADLVETNKALVAENERLKEENTPFRKAWNADQLFAELRTALAAAEAREDKLREALENHGGNYKLSKDECATINSLLDAPRDDSALRRLLAEAKAGVYEECAKVCENLDRYRGDYFAAKIRELAEKAKEEKC